MKRLLPAYPLFVKDPFFSLWSNGEELNDSDVIFWTGEKKSVFGFVTVDGVAYRFLGRGEGRTIPETSLSLTAYTTEYEFENEDIKLYLSFVSPVTPYDRRLLSTPVCFMQYKVEKKRECGISVSLVLGGDVCYNVGKEISRDVRGGKFDLSSLSVAWFGRAQGTPLACSADTEQADWGQFYVGGESAEYTDKPPFPDAVGDSDKWIYASSSRDEGKFVIGFDDSVSVKYFGEYLRGYYFRSGKTVLDALTETYENAERITHKLLLEDSNLRMTAEEYGEEYLNVLYASLRQSVAAHKLVLDGEGKLLFLSKEAGSNGCIGTVDVSYPSAPLYLLSDTELVKGMLRPVFKFARMPVWHYDFAPHDVGQYPICSGQVYGLKRDLSFARVAEGVDTYPDLYLLPESCDVYRHEMQMPVEECANMIIMTYACYYYDRDEKFVRENFDLLSKWVEYLVKYGLKPESQLCTDDFAGHLENNLNLAIKATVGIAAFAELCRVMNEDERHYRIIAEKYADEIEAFGKKYSHLPLTWDVGDETFGLKYNFLYDKILELGLFSRETLEREVDCYLDAANRFGTPLDTRDDYTKSDWLIWCAALTDDREKAKKIISGVNAFLTESPARVPFGDWYYTTGGEKRKFTARSVQGGCFALLLK